MRVGWGQIYPGAKSYWVPLDTKAHWLSLNNSQIPLGASLKWMLNIFSDEAPSASGVDKYVLFPTGRSPKKGHGKSRKGVREASLRRRVIFVCVERG